MNKKIALCALLAASPLQGGVLESYITSFWNQGEKASPNIQVLIAHDQPGAILEVKGKYKLYDPYAQKYISTRFIGKRKFIQPLADGLKWGEEFPGVHQIKIMPDDSKTTTLIDGIEYKGSVYVYDIGGSISIVNEVPLEEYLLVLLTPQFKQKLPEELAAALSITARTQALYQIKNAPTPYWTVEADKVGYEGNAVVAMNSGIAEAVRETKHMVLTSQGAPFQAAWGSASGGSVQGDAPVFSRLSFFEAEKLAQDGAHAAQILERAFPGAKLQNIE
jgi:stage II sporulation protein D